MSDDLKKLIENTNKGVVALREKHEQIECEVKKFGAADYVSSQEMKKIEEHLAKLDEKNDALILEAKRRDRMGRDNDGNEIDLDKKAHDWAASVARKRNKPAPEFDANGMAEYKAAFSRMIRNEAAALSVEEQKALSVGSDPDGGYTVHPDMSGPTIQKVYETSVMRAYAGVVTTGSNEFQGLYDNDEAGYEWVSETGTRSETTTPQIGVYNIPLHELSAMPKATQRLLDDSEFDIEGWLSNKIGARFARAENASFVSGDGVGKPRGYLTYPDGTDLTNSIERIQTGVNGDFAAAPNGGDALIDMVNGLKAEYLSNANWFMNRNSVGKARKLKDSDGAYIWQQSIAAGRPSQLLGYDVAPAFADMPDFATGALPIAFGNMRSAYLIVDRMGIRMLRDPFTAKPHVLFYATKRVGGDLVNGEALKLLEASA